MSNYKVDFIEFQPGTREAMPDIALIIKNETKSGGTNPLNHKKLSKEELLETKDIFTFLESTSCAEDLWNLAACYDLGYGCEQNIVEAKRFYRMAYLQFGLDKGFLSLSDLTCQELLPGWYQVILPDTAEAYEEAANKKFPLANFFLGMCYLNGLGVGEDDELANICFEEARSLKCTDGTKALANSYLRGYGVAKDEEKAISLFKEAYEQGDKGAGINYAGVLYNKGKTIEAINIFVELSKLGFKPAKDALRQLGLL